MDLTELKTDDKTALEGSWIEYGDAKFLVRHTNTKAYRKAIQKAGKGKAPSQLRKNVELQTSFGIEVIVDAVLLDWEGLTKDGKNFPFNRKNAFELLNLSEPIRNFIAEEAQEVANFQQEGEADDAAAVKSKS
tara:strand:- start:16165 stop:16563 length:399 start_codon:yes stop_codon:yes gene_type:complete